MNATAFRLIGIACLLLSVADFPAIAAPAPAPFHFDLGKLPYEAHWGSYSVSIPSESTMRIADSSGRVLKEIQAPFIDTVDYPDISGHGDCEELRIITAAANNTVADWRTYCFSRCGGLHPILEMRGMFLDSIRALDHGARPELLVDDAGALEWVDDISHGSSPHVTLVLRWDGRRYVIANRRFPAVILAAANQYRREFLGAFKDPNWGRDWVEGAAMGYWANRFTIDREASVPKWLLSNLPDGLRAQFLDALPEIRERLDKIPGRITSGR